MVILSRTLFLPSFGIALTALKQRQFQRDQGQLMKPTWNAKYFYALRGEKNIKCAGIGNRSV